MLRTGEFSKISQVSVKALRFYDEIGLLKPTSIDRATGYRYYAPALLSRLNRISALKELGFSLAEIAQLLQTDLSDDQVRVVLQRKRAELSRRIAREQVQLAQVAASGRRMRFTWNRIAQCVVVLLCAFTLKLYYSTASAEELRWILAPTTALVELLSGISFEFESQAGYLSRERGFLIASSCAGVNFLITAFLMLTLGKLLGERSEHTAWSFIPMAAIIAYLATLVANTARIGVALWLQRRSGEINWLTPAQLHRFEGIFIYFGFLLLLFVISEKMRAGKTADQFRQSFFPLLMYYAIAFGIPLLNGAYRQGADFWEHSLTVLLMPLLLILPLAMFRFHRQ
jgi:exosortase K